ncbi:type IV pilus assembly PilZ [Desulfofundulus kuznetsovii DSM 6115]|uniref:Type IV pilus assembly PilZ n=1 Tax=Desulfofundulus kuznetsovii (strain DSM 6115 / VKM B-1805 / 17) TaxID=760568 RepID=A0AAU8PB38_DESK7|nr:type IV pilus assembly PilZ [Desulfofundulus kuznetsovii DSM 6115]
MLDQLRINQKIQVAREGERDWYASTIQDIKGGELHIALPRLRGDVLVLTPGDNVKVRFFDENASFIFPARCLGRTIEAIPLYRLAPTGDCQRVQQRQHVRLKTLLEVHYAHPPEKNRRPRYKKAFTVDISGGGMLLAMDEPVLPGRELLVEFNLPLRTGARKMELRGRVVRLQEREKSKYHVALEFVDITTAQQDLIMRYIFQCMAEQARLTRM